MNRQTMIALGVALVLGLVAVFLANTYLTGRERQLAASPQGMTRVAVASLPLVYGAEITPDKVKFVSYPATSLPPGTYASMEQLLPAGKRRVALRPIQVNQPLLAADLSGEGQTASIAALLPDGMRAATVRINDISGVAGFVRPNDVVDVLITRQAIGPDGVSTGQQVTDVLLQNVRVMAMGSDANANDNNKAKVTRNATLEVTPVDAQKLALGERLGSLSFVLRKPGEDQNIAAIETVSLNDLRYDYYGSTVPGGRPSATAANPAGASVPPAVQRARIARLSQPRSRPAARPAAAPAAPATKTISVTRGTETKDYEVGGYAQ